VYDVRGSLVRTLVDRSLEEGEHEVLWDGRDEEGLSVSSGVYLTVLEARSGTRVRRIVVVR
jgi:flagellar hook assembly protein FlgD